MWSGKGYLPSSMCLLKKIGRPSGHLLFIYTNPKSKMIYQTYSISKKKKKNDTIDVKNY